MYDKDAIVSISQVDLEGRLSAAYWDGHKKGGLDAVEILLKNIDEIEGKVRRKDIVALLEFALVTIKNTA